MAGSPLQTEEELLLVKESVILPIMFEVLEKDMQEMKNSGLKMSELYIDNLRTIQTAVLTRQYVLRKELRARQLKIIEVHRDETFLKVSYQCRGYQHKMDLLWEFVKANIEIRLTADFHLNLE
ncbi:hypothetical protein [Paenibacillus marinisediminis]